MLSRSKEVSVSTSSLVAVFDWILTLDYPKANELSVLIWPMVYWAILVILPLIEAVVVEDATLGYYGFSSAKLVNEYLFDFVVVDQELFWDAS